MHPLYVIAYLHISDTVLLLRRCDNQNFGAGLYSFIGGKVEQGERALAAIKREVMEEVGLDIKESSFELIHTINRKGTENSFIALCFKANISAMPSPFNREPDKHNDLSFFNIHKIPKNTIPAHAQAIDCIKKGINYSEHGW